MHQQYADEMPPPSAPITSPLMANDLSEQGSDDAADFRGDRNAADLGGTLNSIDLATGEIVWQVPFGNFPSQPEPGFGAEYFAFSLP